MSKPKPPSKKILLSLPFWAGDKRQSLKLARFLADLQPSFCDYADVVFTARFDAKHCKETIAAVSRKFNTFTHTSGRRQTGWPLGCNGVFLGMIEWFYHKKAAGQIPNYRAVLNLESDVVPLVRDWLPRVIAAWDELNAKAPVYVAGALLPGNGPGVRDHINGGCCMMSGDMKFMQWLALRASNFNSKVGWDWALAHDFKARGWGNFPGVRSFWQTPSFSETDWANAVTNGDWIIHGVKNDDLLDMSRRKLL